MLAGEFARKLRSLNKQLRIWCGDNDKFPASVFIVKEGEFEQMCGCDKNWVPEHTIFDEQGFITKGGWRRVLRVLIRAGLVDRRHAERVFMTHLPYAKPRNATAVPLYTPKRKLIDKYTLSEDEIKWHSKIRG